MILGVVLREDLKVSSNSQQAYIKASRVLGLMARTVRFRNLEVFMTTPVQKFSQRPHLKYCASAWSPHYVKDRELLVRVQRKVQLNGAGVEKIGIMWKGWRGWG